MRESFGPLAVASCLTFASLAPAQDQPKPEPAAADTNPTATAPPQPAPTTPAEPASAEPHTTVSLRPFGGFTFRADLRDNHGDVSVARAGLGLDLMSPIGDRARFVLNLTTEASWYDFHHAAGVVPGTSDPFNDVYLVNARPALYVSESRQLTWFVGGIVEVAGEGGVNIEDAITGGGFGGVRYYVSENLAFTLGFAAKTRLEESVLPVPLIGVMWNINDHTRFTLNSLTARLETDLRKDLTFFLRGDWELRDYRLEKDAPIPSGVVHDIRVPVGVGFDWSPTDHLKLELTGGAIVWQRFRFDDNNSTRVGEEHTDPAPFLKLEATITF